MKKTLLIVLSLFISFSVLAQTNTYECYLTNINQVDARNLEFDIVMEWTGTNTQLYAYLQGGIDFNYSGMANGGVITGAFVNGSADPGLPSVAQSPNWNLNDISKQIRLLGLIITPASSSIPIPAPPGLRLGTFRLTNTVDFYSGATPDFTWKFIVGSSSTTETKAFFYLGSGQVYTNCTVQSQHHVIGNPVLGVSNIASSNQLPSVFPNPGTNDIYISNDRNISIDELRVYSLSGQLMDAIYSVDSNNAYIKVNVSNLLTGVYFFEIISNREKRIVRFVRI